MNLELVGFNNNQKISGYTERIKVDILVNRRAVASVCVLTLILKITVIRT